MTQKLKVEQVNDKMPKLAVNLEISAVETKQVALFAKEQGIPIDKKWEMLLSEHKTLTVQQAKDILGSHYNDFVKWYDDKYMKNLLPQKGEIETPKLVDMNAAKDFMAKPLEQIAEVKKRDREIGKGLKNDFFT